MTIFLKKTTYSIDNQDNMLITILITI